MQRYLLLFIFLISLSLHAQKREFDVDVYKHTVNYADHKITFQLQPLDSELKFTYPDRNYYWFSSNQLKITQGGFSGKLLHGDYRDFYTDASLKEQGQFKMGLKEGLWKQWTQEGKLSLQITYTAGQQNGRFYKYDTGGNLIEEGNYKNGLLNGKFTKHLSKDSTQVTFYKKGIAQPSDKSKNWFQKLFSKKEKAK